MVIIYRMLLFVEDNANTDFI